MSTMKSLDRNSLEEQTRLVPRYVAGDLSRSERAEFEAWLIASPELAAEVEMERRLRRGMASADRRGWLERGPQSPLLKPPGRRWQVALAASALLAMGLVVSLSLPRQGADSARSRLSAESRTASPLFVRLGKLRSSGSVPDIQLSLANLPSQLTIEPDVVVLTCANGAIELECPGGGVPQSPQYAEYELDVVNRKGNTLAWRSELQQPVMRSQVTFTLRDPARLVAGDYDVVVRGVSAEHQEIVGRFWLNVSP
jgi:hypothetical protein